MASKEEEYKEMFMAEALENYEDLNRLFTELEKDHANKSAIEAIFRITHTLKGNAMGLGFESIAELSHSMEDVFNEIKSGNMALSSELFDTLFKANDKLGALLSALESGKRVAYKGIRTKLQVFLTKAKSEVTDNSGVEQQPAVQSETQAVESSELSVPEANADAPEEEELEDVEPEDTGIKFSDSVNIPVRKLDDLLNLVGELIIERDSLVSTSLEKFSSANEFARLQRITSDLQYSVMDVRLVQVGFLFKKFHRVLRDAASKEGKKVDLKLEGTEIEIDRNVLKIMSDSLVHLVRNSVGHGIETPDERKKAGKPEQGQVTLRARNEKDTVLIDIVDDGAGVDVEGIRKRIVDRGMVSAESAANLSEDDVIMFIFEPGFSNAAQVTEVSGRGVGMDVVKKATESIGGKISVSTEKGKGSVITLSLPSSMAVKGALLFEMNKHEYAIPLSYTEAVISLKPADLHKVSNGLMSTYLGSTFSVLFLKDVLKLDRLSDISHPGVLHESYNALNGDEKLAVIVVSYGNRYVGLVVDKLLQQQEIVEKTLQRPFENIELLSGATILGNGNVCLVMDIATIMKSFFKEQLAYAV